MNIIDATNLKKNFAGEHALAGVSIAVRPGILFGIVGADGAGKTTLMRILATLIEADEGDGTVLSFNVQKEIASIRSRIGYMPQRFSLYEDLTVRENMLFFADIFGVSGKERKDRIERLLSFSRLGPFQNRRAKNLSGGMKQKLALSCALIHTPELLILDEPTTGVDPVSRKEFWAILTDLRAQGITIVVSTPYMDEASFCDELMLMHQGKRILCGSPQELLKGYPLALYELTSHTGAVAMTPSAALPPECSLAYPSGGNVRVAANGRESFEALVLEQSKVFAPGATLVHRVDPTIEDLFFYYLSTLPSASTTLPESKIAHEKKRRHP